MKCPLIVYADTEPIRKRIANSFFGGYENSDSESDPRNGKSKVYEFALK